MLVYERVVVLRCLCREGYQQHYIDKLFISIVLSKITYGLPIYPASPPDFRDCAIITCRGVGKPKGGGHRGKSQLERGRLDVKFNTYREGITFFTLFHKLEKW